jgi:hypothetical protein
MVTLSVSQQQHRESVAQQTMSTADRVSTLLAQNAHLDGHRWTDDQLRSIPGELLDFAWKNSLALRTEFRTEDTFRAYWKQLQGRGR